MGEAQVGRPPPPARVPAAAEGPRPAGCSRLIPPQRRPGPFSAGPRLLLEGRGGAGGDAHSTGGGTRASLA